MQDGKIGVTRILVPIKAEVCGLRPQNSRETDKRTNDDEKTVPPVMPRTFALRG
jgi:hypothetical protein